MIKIKKTDLSKLISYANMEFTNNAIPHNLSSGEIQAYLYVNAVRALLVENGVNIIEIDKIDLFGKAFEIYNSNELIPLPESKKEDK